MAVSLLTGCGTKDPEVKDAAMQDDLVEAYRSFIIDGDLEDYCKDNPLVYGDHKFPSHADFAEFSESFVIDFDNDDVYELLCIFSNSYSTYIVAFEKKGDVIVTIPSPEFHINSGSGAYQNVNILRKDGNIYFHSTDKSEIYHGEDEWWTVKEKIYEFADGRKKPVYSFSSTDGINYYENGEKTDKKEFPEDVLDGYEVILSPHDYVESFEFGKRDYNGGLDRLTEFM